MRVVESGTRAAGVFPDMVDAHAEGLIYPSRQTNRRRGACGPLQAHVSLDKAGDCPRACMSGIFRGGQARSSAGEHYLDMVGVAGSIPAAPTTSPCVFALRFGLEPARARIARPSDRPGREVVPRTGVRRPSPFPRAAPMSGDARAKALSRGGGKGSRAGRSRRRTAGVPGADPKKSPTSCGGRQSAHGSGTYSRKPLRPRARALSVRAARSSMRSWGILAPSRRKSATFRASRPLRPGGFRAEATSPPLRPGARQPPSRPAGFPDA